MCVLARILTSLSHIRACLFAGAYTQPLSGIGYPFVLMSLNYLICSRPTYIIHYIKGCWTRLLFLWVICMLLASGEVSLLLLVHVPRQHNLIPGNDRFNSLLTDMAIKNSPCWQDYSTIVISKDRYPGSTVFFDREAGSLVHPASGFLQDSFTSFCCFTISSPRKTMAFFPLSLKQS